MSKTIRIPNGFLTLCETDFNCPKCGKLHTEEDYINRLNKSDGLIYKRCKGCKTWLGITSNIMGDTVAWLKEDEKDIEIISPN